MAKHRGGRARPHKRKGRQPGKKSFKQYCYAMRQSGMSNDGNGKWVSANQGDLRARALYGGTG